ncbi:MAG: hypothetical protein EOP83_02835 [Verrucomicrobiaceae bacterium]|nr:MAG: hypothetical protein EOP83_02835 [Verrucomicrobiaceae bacterium]
MEDEPTSYGLVVSFEDQSPSFVNGFEAGMLWQQMKTETKIAAATHTQNRETLRRMAIASGFSFEARPSEVAGWDYTEMRKLQPEPTRPNPHGLRVVR